MFESLKLTPAEQRNRTTFSSNLWTLRSRKTTLRSDSILPSGEDRIKIYGPDHTIIQLKSPDEPLSANLRGDAEEEDDEVEDVTLQSHEERLAAIRRKNEARKVSILANIQLPVWMTGQAKINKLELVYALCPT